MNRLLLRRCVSKLYSLMLSDQDDEIINSACEEIYVYFYYSTRYVLLCIYFIQILKNYILAIN